MVNLVTSPTVVFRMLPAGEDPRLPTGIWRVEQNTAGDAAGGYHEFNLELANSSHPGSYKVLFALTHLSVQKLDNTAPPVLIQTSGLTIDPESQAVAVGQYRTIETAVDADSRSKGYVRDIQINQPWLLGYPVDATAAALVIRFPNTNGVIDAVSALGVFWLAEATTLPGGQSTDKGHIASQQGPNYDVGADSYYAKLRKGEPVVPKAAVDQARRIVAVVPQIEQSQVRVGASDEEIIQTVVNRVQQGGSITNAISIALGQSASQVVQQIAQVNASPGQTAPPGYRYANIGGRFDE